MSRWIDALRRAGFAVFARRPAVGAAACLVGGILAHEILPHRPVLWLILLGGLLLAALAARRRAAFCCAIIAAVLVLLGTARAQLDDYFYPADDIGSYTTDQPRLAELDMRIDQPPRILWSPFARFHVPPPKMVTAGDVLRVKTTDGWKPASGHILLAVDQPYPQLDVGQEVRVLGHLQRPAEAANPGQFDWADYYRRQRVLAALTAPRAANVRILTPSPAEPVAWARQAVRRLLDEGFKSAASLDCALLRALVLGDSDPELRDVQEEFRRTGTGHAVTVSGLHVAILGAFVYLVCRLLRLHPRTSAAAGMAFVALFAVAALPAPPMVRSVLLCLSFALGLLLRRHRDRLQLLGLSVMVLLIWNPLDLYSPGFQLSFVTVLGLMVLTEPLRSMLGGRFSEDEKVAMALGRFGPWRRAWLGTRSRAIDIFTMALVAWLVSAPLIVQHYEQLNPWAVAAGLLMLPVVVVGLIGGLLKIVLTALLPSLAGAWASAAAAPIVLMRHMVAALGRLPGSDIPMPAWPLWVIAGYYALLCLPLLWRAGAPGLRGLRQAGRWRWALRGGPAAAALMVLLLPALAGLAPARSSRGDLRVTLLSIGAGQIGCVELPSGSTILIDDGSTTVTDPLRQCLEPFLRHEGCDHIDRIFLSHPDYDHISAAAETAAMYDVDHVYINPDFRVQSQAAPAAADMLVQLDEMGRSPEIIRRGDRINLGDGASIQVLWPPGEPFIPSTNNAGLVLKLQWRGHTVLFPADIQVPPEQALLADAAQLKSDALVAPHHGSSETSTASFVRAVDPQVVLSSNDRRLTHKQREFEKMIGQRPLYRTSRCGAVTLVIAADGTMRVETYFPVGPTIAAP